MLECTKHSCEFPLIICNICIPVIMKLFFIRSHSYVHKLIIYDIITLPVKTSGDQSVKNGSNDQFDKCDVFETRFYFWSGSVFKSSGVARDFQSSCSESYQWKKILQSIIDWLLTNSKYSMINVFICKTYFKEIQFEHVFRCRFEIPLFYPGFSIWCHLNACFVEFNSNHAKLNREGQLKKRNKFILFFSQRRSRCIFQLTAVIYALCLWFNHLVD